MNQARAQAPVQMQAHLGTRILPVTFASAQINLRTSSMGLRCQDRRKVWQQGEPFKLRVNRQAPLDGRAGHSNGADIVRELRALGWSWRRLAERFGCSPNTIKRRSQ